MAGSGSKSPSGGEFLDEMSHLHLEVSEKMEGTPSDHPAWIGIFMDFPF